MAFCKGGVERRPYYIVPSTYLEDLLKSPLTLPTLPPRAEDATDWQWQETSPSKRPTVKFCDLFVEDQRVDSPGVPSSAGQRFLDFPKEIRVRRLS